jgi:4-aminobutyrate aminotransferase-like enzyme
MQQLLDVGSVEHLQNQRYESAQRIVARPPGPKSKEFLANQSNLETKAVVYSKAFPFAIDSAQNTTIRDVDGNLYVDWVSGVFLLGLEMAEQKLVSLNLAE